MNRYVFLACALALTGCQRGGRSEPLVFGHPVPLTGSDRAAARQQLLAIRLAVEDANAETGARPVEVLHADTGGKDDGVTAQATRLLAANRAVALLGGSSASSAGRLALAAQSHPSVLVTPAGWVEPSRYAVSVGLSPAEQGRLLGEFAATLKHAQAAIWVDETKPGAVKLAEAFRQACGFALVPPTGPPQPTFDLVLTAGPRLLGDVAAWVKPGGALILGCEDDELTATWPTAKFDTYFITAGWAEGDFAKRLRDATGDAPLPSAVLCYDAARAAFVATRAADVSLRPMTVTESLLHGEYPTHNGKLKFRADRTAERPAAIVRIRGSQPEVVARTGAPAAP